jgi:hypothetical protein
MFDSTCRRWRQCLTGFDRNKIDQVVAAAHLVKPDPFEDAFDPQTENLLIEADRSLNIGHTEHDMVDT